METALRATGFTQLTILTDSTMSEFQAARDAFLQTLQPGDAVFVYFSGYGVAASDEYYLLPKNFDPGQEIADQAILLSTLVQSIEERRPSLALVMLETSFRADALIKFTDPNPALAEPRLTGVWFADQWTVSGAPPDSANISPLTREVAKAMNREGSTPPGVFDEARRTLAAANGGQIPKSIGTNGSGFFFRAPPVVAVKPIVVPVERPARKRVYRPDRIAYAKVPEGEFKMGCVPVTEKECEPMERPQHRVKISKPFWMAETEVDVASYRRYLAANPGKKMPPAPARNPKWATENRPMVNVSWEQARDYCIWLGGRLPTEAEWERAARGGRDDEAFPMKTLAEARDKANFTGRQGNDTWDDEDAPVKKFDPNPYGLYDLSGNVWEWVSDYMGPYPSTSEVQTDPQGPGTGKEHVMRGGSFSSNPAVHLRLSFRRGTAGAVINLGFRCVLADTPEVLSRMGDEP